MMNINILSVVTPSSIYHGCSTWKTFWEGKFTLGEFTAVNMKNCGCHNVRKHRDIKGSDKYVTLNISLKFNSLDKMKITSSESKFKLGISGKGLITSLGLKAKIRTKKYKKTRYDIGNVSTIQILVGSLNFLYQSLIHKKNIENCLFKEKNVFLNGKQC